MTNRYKGLSDSFYETKLIRTLDDLLRDEGVYLKEVSDLADFEYVADNFCNLIAERKDNSIEIIKLNVLCVTPYCLVTSTLVNGVNYIIKVYRDFSDRSIRSQYVQYEENLASSDIYVSRDKNSPRCTVYKRVKSKSEYTKYSQDALLAKREKEHLQTEYELARKTHDNSIENLYENAPHTSHAREIIGFVDSLGSNMNRSRYNTAASELNKRIKKGSETVIYDDEQLVPIL